MDDEERLLRDVFELFDSDGSGEISVGEFGEILRAMNFNPIESEVQGIIAKYDKDRSGKMNFVELKAWFTETRKVLAKEPKDEQQKLQEAFKVFDRNGDGFISLTEIRHLMEKMGDPVTDEFIKDMLESCDLNGDGRICITEFAAFLCQPLMASKT